jgi:hypothetical protein
MLLFLLHFLMPLNVLTDTDILKVRKQYYLAIESEKEARVLESLLGEIKPKTTTLLGYEGASKMLMAKHVFMPNQKFSYFNKGKEILEGAITKEAGNIELVFLRFGIQSTCPSFLKYNQSLEKDRKMLITEVKNLKDRDLKNRILTYLITKSNLTDAERSLIQ